MYISVYTYGQEYFHMYIWMCSFSLQSACLFAPLSGSVRFFPAVWVFENDTVSVQVPWSFKIIFICLSSCKFLDVFRHAHIDTCAHTHAQIYMYTYTIQVRQEQSKHTHRHMHTHRCRYMMRYVNIYIYIHVHMYTVYTHMCINKFMNSIYTYTSSIFLSIISCDLSL